MKSKNGNHFVARTEVDKNEREVYQIIQKTELCTKDDIVFRSMFSSGQIGTLLKKLREKGKVKMRRHPEYGRKYVYETSD